MAANKDLEHAWSYFALHANQRITVFNYFVVFAGVISTGMAAAIQASAKFAFVGIGLGALLTVLSFVFWKIDQRTAFLIKHAEEAIKLLEPSAAPLVASEEQKTLTAKRKGIWTYGQAFRTIFAVMALIGLAGAILAGLRTVGIVGWETENDVAVSEKHGAITTPNASSLGDACGSHCTGHTPTHLCGTRRSTPGG